MEALEHVLRLARTGRYGDSLRAFDETKPRPFARPAAEILRAQLLEFVGQSEPALSSAISLLRLKHLTPPQRSQCETVVGKILFDEGDADSGLDHLQRAALSAQQGGDLHALFSAKLFTLIMLSDRFGPAAASSVLAELRQLATKLGDPEVTARLHLFVAQAEAKRGLLDNARRHTSMARRILKTSSNVYLSAFTANQDLALAVIRSEFDVARDCGQRAIELAEQSGVAKLRKAVFGNLGNLYVELGEFDRATKFADDFKTSVSGVAAGVAGCAAPLAAATCVGGAGSALESSSVAFTSCSVRVVGGPLVTTRAVNLSPRFRSPTRTDFPSLMIWTPLLSNSPWVNRRDSPSDPRTDTE